METTTKLYYNNPVPYRCDSLVLSVSGGGPGESEVVIDASPFYPEGGGQPCDLGTLGDFALLRVSEDHGIVRHFIAGSPEELRLGGLIPGEKIHCVVDDARRIDHTCQHSCQHLLSSLVLRILGGATKSFHLGAAWSSIDVDLPEIAIDDLLAVERALELAIRESYIFVTHECTAEEAGKLPLRRKVPEVDGIIRIVEIDGIDYTPCCGTHVRASSELQACRLLKSEKYKGMSRIYFIAGKRALDDYRGLALGARLAAGLLGCSEAEIANLVGAQKAKLAETECLLKTMQDDCAGYQARILASENPSTEIITSTSSAYSFAYASTLAKALASLGKIALVGCGLRAAFAAPSSSIALSGILKPLVAAHDVKGGGGDTFFQVSASSEEALCTFLDAASTIMNGAFPKNGPA